MIFFTSIFSRLFRVPLYTLSLTVMLLSCLSGLAQETAEQPVDTARERRIREWRQQQAEIRWKKRMDSIRQVRALERQVDSLWAYRADTVRKAIAEGKLRLFLLIPDTTRSKQFGKVYGPNVETLLWTHAFYPNGVAPQKVIQSERKVASRDWIFYWLLSLVFLLGLLNRMFPGYFSALLHVYTQSTVKVRNWKEQFQSAVLPSLLLNLFFVISAGMFVFFLFRHYGILQDMNRYLLLAACIGALLLVYLGKYLILTLVGWMFDQRSAIDSYIFIVFLVNKTIGVCLVPFTLVLALGSAGTREVVITLSVIMLAGLLLYRYIRAFSVVRSDLRVSGFQFFLYLCAFEFVPVALLYKIVQEIIQRSA